ncbi:MAG: amidohydrolase family protein, partial [Candidatus Binatia bacterium]
VKELRRAVKRYGMVGGILPADGLQLPLGHKQYWPVYEDADRLGCTLSVHSCNSLRDNDRYLVPNEAATLTHVIPQMRQFTNIMFSGVMNKLKKLRLGFLEAGSGWTPYLISKIEDRLQRVAPAERPVLPSELLARRQLYFQCGEEVTTKRDVELLGDDCLLWASDFPHEATRTDMKKLVKEHFARKDLTPAAKRKIIYDNAKRFYRL